MTEVVDPSVALKWFVADGDANDALAEKVLHEIIARPSRFLVPELFFYELFAVLCRRLKQRGDVARAMNRATRLGLHRVRLDERLIRRAARITFDYRLTGYDACYAALAIELDATWVTFDTSAHDRVRALGISRVPGEDDE